jgi:hypothetical protein
MAKAMRVPVLVIENKQEADILVNALTLYVEKGAKIRKAEEMRNEIQKIVTIFEKTNNN